MISHFRRKEEGVQSGEKRFQTDNFISLNFAAYDLLVIIESAIGWNGFLDLRNSVFITNIDVDKTEMERKLEEQRSRDETVEVDIGALTVSEETDVGDSQKKEDEKKDFANGEIRKHAKAIEDHGVGTSENSKVDISAMAVPVETDACDSKEEEDEGKNVTSEETEKNAKSGGR